MANYYAEKKLYTYTPKVYLVENVYIIEEENMKLREQASFLIELLKKE